MLVLNQKRKAFIVIAGAHAKPEACGIKGHQWCQYEIQPARVDAPSVTGSRLGDAKTIIGERYVRSGVRKPQPVSGPYDRKVKLLAQPDRGCGDRSGVYFAVKRNIRCDSFAAPEYLGVGYEAMYSACCHGSLCVIKYAPGLSLRQSDACAGGSCHERNAGTSPPMPS